MRFSCSTLLAAAATIAGTAASTSSSAAAGQGAEGELHLLRRRTTRPDGVPLHQYLNAERSRLKHKYSKNKKHNSKSKSSRRSLAADAIERDQQQKRAGYATFGDKTNTLYYAAVTVGTPPKSFPIGIDSGSSDLWISGENWKGASASSTFKRNGNPFEVQYEDGTSVQGYQGTDVVSFAGYNATTAISVGTTLSSNAAPAPADGIFGFGWPALATGQEAPFWITSGANRFAMYLASTSNFGDSYAYGGVIHLGAVNSSFYQGDINYVPITAQLYWTVILQGLSVGGSSISLPSNQEAVIDSGTSLIGAPNDIVRNFYASIPNAREVSGSQGFWEYPCDASNLGIQLTFGGQAYAIPDENFIFDNSSGGYCVGALFESGDDSASSSGGGGSSNSSSSQIIVGDSFMRGVYTVFDGPKSAVGFATLASNVPTTGPDFNDASSSGGSGNSGSGGGSSGSGGSGGSGGGGGLGGIFGSSAPVRAGLPGMLGASVAAGLVGALVVLVA